MNPIVGQLLSPQYSINLIALSYAISFLGSLVALVCARRMIRADGTVNRAMLGCAAVSLGGIGIWSMHFIGMLAYRLPISIVYDIPLTVVSLLAAILISGIALYLAGGRRFHPRTGWLAGSLLAGVGVCVMHYMGMFAMNMRATMTLNSGIVAASAAIAIVAAGAALWLAFNLTKLTHQVVAAAVMGVAVCTMHFVGMTAADMVCTAAAPANALTVGGSYLALGVFGISGAVLLLIFWIVSEHALEAPASMARAA